MTKKNSWIVTGIASLVIILTLMWATSSVPASKSLPTTVRNWHATIEQSTSTKVLQVVAAENFWGSLISQLGGSHVQVVSIVSDPNADPHEYETNTTNARQIAEADYVIVNGAGYDSWADKLLSAGGGSDRSVLNVAQLLGKKEGDNPHFWYNPDYVNNVVRQMEADLISKDPTDADYFAEQYALVQTRLMKYDQRISEIKQKFAGTKVASTEDIFVYLAGAAGLDLVSPPAFIQAVGEGTDPPTASVVTFEGQLTSKSVKVLVYNEQTTTPLTENVKKIAAQQGIPVVGVTETIQPPDMPFEDWMDAQVKGLQDALSSTTSTRTN